jgi:hypothetical protein
VGNRWNRENITVYGRALVSNTLMMPIIMFRARVNGITQKLQKEILKKVKEFVWRKVPVLKWSIAIRGIKEGGIGVKDPACIVSSMRIKLIRDMKEKKTQPWVKWMQRKEAKLEQKWQVKNVYDKGMSKKKINELKETCLLESAVKVWHEMKGKIMKENDEELMMIKIEEEWRDLTTLKGKEVYAQLVRLRYGELKDDEQRANHAMTTIANKLTPQQRQFWWRVAHKKYTTNNTAHKYKSDGRGRAPNECSVCRNEVETWEHMEYDCDGMKHWMKRLKNVHANYTEKKEGEWKIPTREEWRLNAELEMKEGTMIVIAIARWVYHKERCKLVHRQRRRLDLERLEEYLEDELRTIKEKEEKDEKKEKEGRGRKGKKQRKEKKKGKEGGKQQRQRERRRRAERREEKKERRRETREKHEAPLKPMIGLCVNFDCSSIKGDSGHCPCSLANLTRFRESARKEGKREEVEDRREEEEDRREEEEEKREEEERKKGEEEKKRNREGEGGEES